MSPAGGIGVNAAMKDSDVLAPIICDALQAQDFSRAKLMAFEQMRRDEIDKLQEGQVRQEKAMEKLNKSIMLKRLFYWNMRVLDKMPWKGKIFAKMYAANK